MKIIDFMPWILKMEFDGKKFLSMEDVFHIYKEYKEE
jgi:2,3-bisphosphoglycerate-dependent phosphoglycerate mutase